MCTHCSSHNPKRGNSKIIIDDKTLLIKSAAPSPGLPYIDWPAGLNRLFLDLQELVDAILLGSGIVVNTRTGTDRDLATDDHIFL